MVLYLVLGWADVTAWSTALVAHDGSNPKSFPVMEAFRIDLNAGGYILISSGVIVALTDLIILGASITIPPRVAAG